MKSKGNQIIKNENKSYTKDRITSVKLVAISNADSNAVCHSQLMSAAGYTGGWPGLRGCKSLTSPAPGSFFRISGYINPSFKGLR